MNKKTLNRTSAARKRPRVNRGLRPMIRVCRGQLPYAVDAAEAALAADAEDLRLFQDERGRIVRQEDGSFRALSTHALLDMLERNVVWVDASGYTRIDCPPEVALRILARARCGRSQLPAVANTANRMAG